MFRFKLYNDNDYYNFGGRRDFVEYEERIFDNIMNCSFSDDEEATPPFRDAESLLFLRSQGSDMVEDDYYSCIINYGNIFKRRECISNVNNYTKYALSLIDYSRRGKYLSFRFIPIEFMEVLGNLPFDILIAIKYSDVENIELSYNKEYILEKFPFRGRFITVKVVYEIMRDGVDGFKHVGSRRKDAYWSHLYEKNNEYYISSVEMDISLRFLWKAHIPELIDYIKEMPEKVIIFNPENRMELDKFFDKLEYSYDEAETEGYIVNNHIVELPNIYSRKLPLMLIDELDGSFYIHGALTVKNPDFSEIIFDIISLYNGKGKMHFLVVDVDELLKDKSSLEHTIFGGAIEDKIIELNPKTQALNNFVNVLETAYNSKNTKIDDEFY